MYWWIWSISICKMTFSDRKQAGELLAGALGKFRNEHCVVYAIPRGGVVLGAEIAKEYDWPLDLVITRKVGHPYSSEFAVCVVTEDGSEMCDEAETSGIDKAWLEEEKQKERLEAKRRRELYLAGREKVEVQGKTAIIVDDGIATGMTFLMAVKALRKLMPTKIIAAIPVMPAEFAARLKNEVDEIVCLNVDENYSGAVGAYYGSFPQVSDEEVVMLLREN